MLMADVTLVQVREALAAVVAGNEEFIYNPAGGGACYYKPVTAEMLRNIYSDNTFSEFREREPQKCKTGCIVGETVKRLEITDFPFGSMNRVGSIWPNESREQSQVSEYLGVAQFAQDQGYSWGEAFVRAERGAETWFVVEPPSDPQPF